MPLNGSIIKSTSAAVISVAGGVDVSFAADNIPVENGAHFVDMSISDFRLRPQLTAKYRQPSQSYKNGAVQWSKDRNTLLYVQPFVDSLGTLHYTLLEIRRETHPEQTSDQKLELNRRGAQMLFDTDFANFWAIGATI